MIDGFLSNFKDFTQTTTFTIVGIVCFVVILVLNSLIDKIRNNKNKGA